MCGRFTLRTPQNLLVDQFMLAVTPSLQARYNIAPTQTIGVIRESESDRQRKLSFARWGLVPAWANEASIGNRMINARSETVEEKPAYRAAFRSRRCLIPADGFFEWKGSGGSKQPYLFRMRDNGLFAFAGLWESWIDRKNGADLAPLETCTILTTTPNDITSPIRDRMPVILTPNDYSQWLDPQLKNPEVLKPLLRPFDAQLMRVDRVGRYVNNARHEGPECVEIQQELF